MKDKKVGYKSPPQEHRFTKGQSGNPLGRLPVKTESFNTLLKEEALREISFVKDGEVHTMSNLEIALRKALRDALNGDLRKAKIFLDAEKKEKSQDGAPQYRQYNVIVKRGVAYETLQGI